VFLNTSLKRILGREAEGVQKVALERLALPSCVPETTVSDMSPGTEHVS
jgi:hypothetical protein